MKIKSLLLIAAFIPTLVFAQNILGSASNSNASKGSGGNGGAGGVGASSNKAEKNLTPPVMPE
jgi:hypothetical protein